MGDDAARKAMAQAQPGDTDLHNVDANLPIDVVRNLIYSGAPEDLAQLRQIVDSMSPRAKSNLMKSIALSTRDPQVPSGVDPKTGKARPISLTPEGKMMMATVFDGADPDASLKPGEPSLVMNKPVTPGGGTRLETLSAEADLEPHAFQPQYQSDSRVTKKDVPAFRGKETVTEDKNGNFTIEYLNQAYDRQTKAAIKRAEEGLRVGPIYDDALNTPPGRRAGTALVSGTRTPKEEVTRLMHRLAETSNSHGVVDSRRADDPLMFEAADGNQDNPSVFAPGNTGSKMKRHVTSVRPADHSDALRAFQNVKKGKFTTPNQQYNSAEEFARAFVESADPEGLNITPITPGQRADATALIDDYSNNPDNLIDRIVNGDEQGNVKPSTAGRLVKENMPDTVRATKTAERALMQEQTIASLTRKFEDIFGHQGWGENYRPSTRPGTDEPVAPAGGIGEGVATTQDPANVPDRNVHAIGTANRRGTPGVDGRSYDEKLTSYEQEKDAALRRIKQGDPDTGTGYFDESQPVVRTPQKPRAPLDSGNPGMELGEDVGPEELADLQQQVGGEGGPISTEEVDPNFARGRDLGDRSRVGQTKTREVTGHKPGAYNEVGRGADGQRKLFPDGQRPFAAYNRENRVVSDSDLERRLLFAKEWNKTVGGETERSSVLRQQLRELIENRNPVNGNAIPEAPGTSAAAERATQIAELQRRLRLAERLDTMSKVNSMQTMDPETGTVTRPFNPFPAQTGGDLIPVTPAHPGSAGGSMVPGSQSAAPGGALIPSTTADLQGGKLAASSTPIDADEILPPRRDLDLNNEPIDAEFEIKREPDPVEVKREPDLEDVVINRPEDPSLRTPDATPQAEPQWKKWAKRAGLVGGALGIRELLIRGGQPPVGGGQPPVGGGIEPPPPGNIPPMGPQGPEGFPFPYVPRGGEGSQDLGAKPEDRIRALRNFNMNLNPNTQILQNWTR
jgi:hypothetical protein